MSSEVVLQSFSLPFLRMKEKCTFTPTIHNINLYSLMTHSKLLLRTLQGNNGVTKVTVTPRSSLHQALPFSGLFKDETEKDRITLTFLTKERKGPPQVTRLYLFSVDEELRRIPRVHSVLSFRDIQRAIFIRGRCATQDESLSVILNGGELFGDRLIIFPLRHSVCVEGQTFSFLSWKNHGDREGGHLELVPRAYLFTKDTWIAFCRRGKRKVLVEA